MRSGLFMLIEKDKYVVESIDFYMQYEKLKRELNKKQSKWTMTLGLGSLSFMVVSLLIALFVSPLPESVRFSVGPILIYAYMALATMWMGFVVWNTKKEDDKVKEFESKITHSDMYYKFKQMKAESFVYTANDLLKDQGSDKHIIMYNNGYLEYCEG